MPVARPSSAKADEERLVLIALAGFLDTLLSSGFG